jgi:hypothetical protein
MLSYAFRVNDTATSFDVWLSQLSIYHKLIATSMQETRMNAPAAEAKEIALYGGINVESKKLFINKLDNSLATLRECECVRLNRYSLALILIDFPGKT